MSNVERAAEVIHACLWGDVVLYETPDDATEIAKALADAGLLLPDDPYGGKHVIRLQDEGWIITHPLSERLAGSLLDCQVTWDDDDCWQRGDFYLEWDEDAQDWTLGERL